MSGHRLTTGHIRQETRAALCVSYIYSIMKKTLVQEESLKNAKEAVVLLMN
jgi:hypothetical protein